MEAKSKTLAVCSVVGFLGLLSAATGFAAEAKRIRYNQITFPSPSECVYPRTPALGLALTASVSLLMAQIIINVATGCICCRKGPHQSHSSWTIAIICFIVSWFTFVIAFLLLLTGAALNDPHGNENAYFSTSFCYVIRPGVFAGAAALSLSSVVLGILYYLVLSGAAGRNPSTGPGVVAMGEAQFPPPPPPQNDPVFVHEDTYMRRQLT
ncbi:hypothetical protein M569_11129 [Genlisea aurea]|uniref:Uncharacterized protein n=1 Tax=Genlisea aurea TaxID=192259 RepID=S8CGF3_9LAMI|nr:hypothetical protein M569_11129 [Genlisea aurea]